MCGFLCHLTDSATDLLADYEKATQHIKKRGADYYNEVYFENIFLAHARMSIYDLDGRASQPMVCRTGRNKIVFNGSIYNYRELKRQLEACGQVFLTTSDTEVLLKGLILHGVEFLGRLRGTWAFVFVSLDARQIIISRDVFGEKPLYQRKLNSGITFASSIMSLVSIGDTPSVNLEMVKDFLIYAKPFHGNRLFFNEVAEFPANTYAVYDIDNLKVLQTGTIFDVQNVTSPTQNTNLNDVLEQACSRITIADVKVAATLSGGVDSSLISSLIHRQVSDMFCANNVSGESEIVHAQRVAEAVGINLHSIDVRSQTIIENLQDTIAAQEQPFAGPSVILQNFVYKNISEYGYKVCVEGQGADELFLGYPRYQSMLLFEFCKKFRWIQFIKTFKLFRSSDTNFSILGLLLSVIYFHSRYIRAVVAIWRYNIPFRSWRLPSQEDLAAPYKYWDLSDIFGAQLGNLLAYADKNSMYYQVETRLPFLDSDVARVALQIPPSLKMKFGQLKYVLKNSLRSQNLHFVADRTTKCGYQPDNAAIYRKIQLSFDKRKVNQEWLSWLADFFGSDLSRLKPVLFFRAYVVLQYIMYLEDKDIVVHTE